MTKSKGVYGAKEIFNEYFPRQSINYQEFRIFIEQFNLNEEDIVGLFDFFDFQKDGEVDIDEFEYRSYQSNFKEAPINLQLQKYKAKAIVKDLRDLIIKNNINIERLFRNYNQNDDDVLDQDEFLELIKKIDPKISEIEAIHAFKYFD